MKALVIGLSITVLLLDVVEILITNRVIMRFAKPISGFNLFFLVLINFLLIYSILGLRGHH